MISKIRKNSNKRLKRSIRQTGGITLMEGKYAFFVNKKNYETLFGKPIIGEKAPSIKDIEKNFDLKGYYLKNNTNTLHLIGWDNLSEYRKKKQLINHEEKVKSFNNFVRQYGIDLEYGSHMILGIPSFDVDNIINLDEDSNVEQVLISKFNYDRLIPSNYTVQKVIYKDNLDYTPIVEDSYFCVIIQVNYLLHNKYINIIEKDITIINQEDEINKKAHLMFLENSKIEFPADRTHKRQLEKIKKLIELPLYQKMDSELKELWKNHMHSLSQIKRNKKEVREKKQLYDIQKKEIIETYAKLIENELNHNGVYINQENTEQSNDVNHENTEQSNDVDTLEDLLYLKNHMKL
jgi:hypothetical protein